MRAITGLALLSTGLAVGTFTYFPDLLEPDRPAGAVRSVPETAAPAPLQPVARSDEHAAAGAPRTFSPSRPLFTIPSQAESRATPATPPDPVSAVGSAPGDKSATQQIASSAATAEADRASGWTAVVTAYDRVTGSAAQRLSKPGDPTQRANLARDLQRELKRVGCYDAEIDGDWGGASKRAMSAFTDRVNATLPVDDPDYILLTLLQGHQGAACGRDCPSGQGLNEDGRCIPRAILAKAARKSNGKDTRLAQQQSREKAIAERKAIEERRIAEERQAASEAKRLAEEQRRDQQRRLAEAKTGDAKVARDTTRDARQLGDGSSTTTVALTAAAPAIPPVPNVIRPTVEPLPGRMAIGGPRPDMQPAPVTQSPAFSSQPPAPAAREADTTGSHRVSAAVEEHQAGNGNLTGNATIKQPDRKSSRSDRGAVHSAPAHRAPKPQKYAAPYYVGKVYAPQPSKSSRQRQMIYQLFQNPNRTMN